MPVLDFKEIAQGNIADGNQDSFELFAEDFFELLGYKIIQGPSRGSDGGKDLILEERRTGVGGETKIKWLVSCKHKAHSGASVGVSDEQNINDRINSNLCQGFIGFYSTLSSSALSESLQKQINFENIIYSKEKIENILLSSNKGIHLARRYFSKSMEVWIRENPKAADINLSTDKLLCENCNKDLLEPNVSGIIVIWGTYLENKIQKKHVYWCCKGECDRILSSKISENKLSDRWEDISDIVIPIYYLKWIIGSLNNISDGDTFTKTAFEKYKDFLITLFPYVSRNATSSEKERLETLRKIDRL